MLIAAWWGFVGGAALLVGALIALVAKIPTKVLGLVMGFGAGVLFSAAAFELTQEAHHRAGAWPVAAGLAAGAITFFVGDWLVDSRGGHRRKNPTGEHQTNASGMTLVIGALLDGIPESAAIGVSLLEGGGVGIAMVLAVFLSNVPESLSATSGLRAGGRSIRYILGLWLAVCVACAAAAALGYVLLEGAPPSTVAVIQAFAAGAIITMLADTMVPEATTHGGRTVGLVVVLGFAAAFFLSAR